MVLVLLLSTSFWLPQTHAAQLRISVVLSEGSGAYQEFANSLQSHNSGQYIIRMVGVGEAVQDADLVIAVGMKAASALTSSTLPVLNVFVPRAGFEILNRAPSPKSSAIFMDQPMERQFDLMQSVLPEVKEIGILYATPPVELGALRKLAANKRITLYEHLIDHDHSLASSLSELLEHSEVLFVLPDVAVYSSETIRNILLETYRKQVPMIGISHNYVRAGALCAVYSTPQQFAEQTYQIIVQFSASGKLPGNQYPTEFEVAVNSQVARSLGLNIKDADRLRAEIRRKP